MNENMNNEMVEHLTESVEDITYNNVKPNPDKKFAMAMAIGATIGVGAKTVFDFGLKKYSEYKAKKNKKPEIIDVEAEDITEVEEK